MSVPSIVPLVPGFAFDCSVPLVMPCILSCVLDPICLVSSGPVCLPWCVSCSDSVDILFGFSAPECPIYTTVPGMGDYVYRHISGHLLPVWC